MRPDKMASGVAHVMSLFLLKTGVVKSITLKLRVITESQPRNEPFGLVIV